MTISELLELYEEAATRGGSGSEFLARAYVSWYRPNDDFKVNLYDATRLDGKNRALFFALLYCREVGDFDDEALYQLEQRLKKHWEL